MTAAPGKHTFHCIDAHSCGNPVRLVAEGGPVLEGATMADRRAHFLREYDWVRTALMLYCFISFASSIMPAIDKVLPFCTSTS